ncbi:hypothetical protein GP475_00870 [Corynebacterium poyangense]|uniref:Galactan 5-O-arabinofuranosyltransferase n=1 Tax=Corynebacterium poyangense TaxID=2684405 RepID=A0A7H0SLC1_9CORY|nr:galactan 5-O-arabinofuranosyltransferase [Corynebacterium poyangense]MBZ8177435.1 hypothetical protein [Corynebacterium poyangense]QNQ89346.1 hypothetical protein GP475_00870 [Corynebacterium poyangense]
MTTIESSSGSVPADPDLFDPPVNESYATDLPSQRATLLGILGAGLGGGGFVLGCWAVLKRVDLPAFSTSMVLRALATACTIGLLLVVGGLLLWWLWDEQSADAARRKKMGETSTPLLELHRPRWRIWLTHVACYIAPAGLVFSSTGIPLSATRLYLEGLQVDQGFRTQFLTRMAETLALKDMNYVDLPSFYPSGWFWLGGRLANLLGMPGWEVYQPWALVSLGIAASILVPVWQRITGSLTVATAIALVNTCVVLVMAAEEPYAAIVALGAPAATVLARRALLGSRWCILAVLIYLGISATMYTLFTALIALSVVACAAAAALLETRSWWPLLRLLIIGVGSMLIAATVWGPYLLALLRGDAHAHSTANHYLPQAGTEIPIPFLAPSMLGLLCFIGLIYLVARALDHDVRALGLGLIVFYLWAVASMVMTLAGSTLLGFRIDTVIVLQLATAGVLAIAEFRLVGIERLYPDRMTPKLSRTITLIMMVVLIFGGVKYAQSIPERNQSSIDHAYTDTDGYGERADRFSGDAGQYYGQINDFLISAGKDPDNTVVLTDERNFLSLFPYYGFQAATSHYANPLGEFSRRNTQIENWAERSWKDLADPESFKTALDSAPWRAPEVFIFRGSLENDQDGWKTHISEDIYPNNPNVRFTAVRFNPHSFSGGSWEIKEIGPFVVVVRK